MPARVFVAIFAIAAFLYIFTNLVPTPTRHRVWVELAKYAWPLFVAVVAVLGVIALSSNVQLRLF